MKKQFLRLFAITVIALTISQTNSNAQTSWKITGNSGIDSLTNFLGTTDKKPLIFKTNNKERMRILWGGKVGIGTSTPSARLNVVSGDIVTLSSPGMLMLGNVSGLNMAMDYDVIQARNNGAAASIWLNYYGGTTYLGPSSAVQIATTGILTTVKNAGIMGASNASYALNVNANSTFGGINITDPVDRTGLVITKSGLNYGISVTKSSTSSATATIYSSNAGSGAALYGSGAAGNGVYGYNSGANAGVYGYSSGGTGSIGVSGYCNGIGYGMSAYGDLGSGIYATSNSNYAGYFVGDVYSSGNYVGSDARLKQNVKDVSKAMDIINQLQPKLYNFRDDGNYKLMHLPKGNHYGLIAQDVEKILPNLVRDTKFETAMAKPHGLPSDKEGVQPQKVSSETIDFKAVNYTELIPIIIKGMQEQQAIIEKQQQQIDALQQMMQNTTNASNSSDIKSVASSSAYLLQNAPNPFSQNTLVKCFVPSTVKQAKLTVYNSAGQLLKSYTLTGGMNSININGGTLSAGQYAYTLIADGKKIDSKNMILTK